MSEREPFQTITLRQTTSGQIPAWWPRPIARDSRPKSGGKTKNEAVGGTGARVFVDCDGAEVSRISWERGLIQEDGSETIQVGSCSGGTGGTGGSEP